MLMRQNFFKELEYYDKDHVPDKIFKILKRYVNDVRFAPEYVAKGSKAAAGLCQWVSILNSPFRAKR